MNTIGIDIGGTSIKSVLVAADGAIVCRDSRPTRADGGPEAILEQVHNAIGALAASASIADVAGIGIGMPGSVDAARGMILHPPNLPGWGEVPVVALVSSRWNIPVHIDNDANCAALGEARFGAGRSHRNFIGLTLGTGVGSGIILDGRIWHGEHGFGGEFGHMTIDRNGPRCACGNTGCVEAFVGNGYIVANARAFLAHHPESALHESAMRNAADFTPRRIAEAAHAGDAAAREILFDTGAALGAAIASAANLLDVRTFIIGGGVSAAGAPLFDGITAGADARVLPVHRGMLRIIPASLGNDAGMLGAASLARDAIARDAP